MAWILTALMPPESSGAALALWLAGALAAGLVLCVVVGLVTGLLVAVLGVHPILVTLGTMTLLARLQHLFHPRPHSLRLPGRLWWPSQRDDPRHRRSRSCSSCCRRGARAPAPQPHAARHPHPHDRLEPRGDALFGRRHAPGAGLGLLLSSLLCWLAAVVMMARFNSAGADIAQSYLLITILAAILGGIDPYGGFGRIVGLFLALCILQVISSGFNLLGLSPHLALASWGLILLARHGGSSVRPRPGERGVGQPESHIIGRPVDERLDWRWRRERATIFRPPLPAACFPRYDRDVLPFPGRPCRDPAPRSPARYAYDPPYSA